ncbi:MAG: IS66 family transposase [Actinobacteria bacterium]|nr:IS66 family transposase [Actinomycetota bacterium]
MVWDHYLDTSFQACDYERQLEELNGELDQERSQNLALQKENQELKAQLHALHQRQFKGRSQPETPESGSAATTPKKRGAPKGHPPWQRSKPKRIDQRIRVPAPTRCPRCQQLKLKLVPKMHEHVQEDIVLAARTLTTCYEHELAYCPNCAQELWQLGPGELPGAYIGPVAKATAAYMRFELNVSHRKISRFFADFFGLSFVPASSYGFERQAARRGAPLYEDLRQKIRSLPVVHADETSWRHDGQGYWVWYAGNEELAYFQLDAHRSGEAAQRLLGQQLSGILVSDAYAAYNAVQTKDWQSCLVHLQRKARELEQELALLKGQARDERAQKFCRQLKEFFGEACAIGQKFQRGSWRAKAARKQEKALRHQLAKLCRKPLGYPRAEAFRKRLLGPEQRHLFTFLRHPRVPATNNQAERSLRPIVILRKVIQGTRSAGGLEDHSILQSLKETARRQGKKVHQFFQDLFHKDAAEAQAALYRRPMPLKAKRKKPMRC